MCKETILFYRLPRKCCQKDKSTTSLKRSMSLSDLQNHICLQFPGVPLELVGFTLGRATKRKAIIKVEFANMAQLKKEVGRGRLYIMPKNKITPDMIATPIDSTGMDSGSEHSVGSTELAVEEIQENAAFNTDVKNDGSEERPGTSQDSLFSSAQPTSEPTSSTSLIDENMPDIRRRRQSRTMLGGRRNPRAASQLARHQIREWCNGDTPLIEISEDEMSNISLTNPGNENTVASSQTRSVITEMKRKEEEERRKHDDERLVEEQKKATDLEQLRIERKSRLPEEPSDGFKLKFKSSTSWIDVTRRFKGSSEMSVLQDFIGSLEGATQKFEIFVAHRSPPISSSERRGKLADLGIIHPTVIRIQWLNEETCSAQNYAEKVEKTENIQKDSSDTEFIDPEIAENETLPLDRSSVESRLTDKDGVISLCDLLDYSDEGTEETTSQESQSLQYDSPCTSTFNMLNDTRDLLLNWKLNTINLDEHQKIVVSLHPRSLWEHALRCYKRQSFNIKNVLKVEFRNECGEDEGGLRREFFEILLRQMFISPYFEDTGNGFEVAPNMIGYIEGHFTTIGKMIASILVQGGAFQPSLSHGMIMYGIKGMDAATLEMVDGKHRKLIEKIEKEKVELLNSDTTILDMLEDAGIHLIVSSSSRPTIVKALVAHYSKFNSKKLMLDAFWEGAEQLGLQTLLKEHTVEVKQVLCKCCGKQKVTTGDEFMEMMIVTKYGESRSNERRQSEQLAQNFESFVYDCEEGKCWHLGKKITLEDLMKFITGCSTVPPGGFDCKFTLNFTKDTCYPSVSACTFDLKLPLNLTSFPKFKEVMMESIISGSGFGMI
ncbi:uncharacterized protein LOC143083024 isoform X2 [Mytilus galloprovincialis]|uniref:uncharacterized protein LOC143083024 isoform X2 n=1 Tax=Mytilus galloprovincialis TaxID=29158 RepID=UPI003F7C9587